MKKITIMLSLLTFLSACFGKKNEVQNEPNLKKHQMIHNEDFEDEDFEDEELLEDEEEFELEEDENFDEDDIDEYEEDEDWGDIDLDDLDQEEWEYLKKYMNQKPRYKRKNQRFNDENYDDDELL